MFKMEMINFQYHGPDAPFILVTLTLHKGVESIRATVKLPFDESMTLAQINEAARARAHENQPH